MAAALERRRVPESKTLTEVTPAVQVDPVELTADVIRQMITARPRRRVRRPPGLRVGDQRAAPGARSGHRHDDLRLHRGRAGLRPRRRRARPPVRPHRGPGARQTPASTGRRSGVNRVKDEFLATLSHELRTPLNAILGWARLLRLGKLDEAARARALETIERNASAQAQLIEDLLDVSRIISGKFQVEVRLVDVPTVTEAALDAVRLAAEAKSINLVARLDPVPQLAGDPTRLQQVVWNLLSNAIKFTPKGGRVEVRVTTVDSHVEIEVTDNGEGIRADFLPYVFDRFRQADGTTTRAHSGARPGPGHRAPPGRAPRRLGAGAERREGRGAVFSVRLPVAAVRPKPLDDGSADLGRAQRGAPGEGTLPLSGLRVVVVDDETDARELVAAVLTESGARVIAVGSVAEAILAIERHRPDVLVSDIGMPSEDGYSLMRKLKAMEKTVGRIPAAALTAYATVQDRTRALFAGTRPTSPSRSTPRSSRPSSPTSPAARPAAKAVQKESPGRRARGGDRAAARSVRAGPHRGSPARAAPAAPRRGARGSARTDGRAAPCAGR